MASERRYDMPPLRSTIVPCVPQPIALLPNLPYGRGTMMSVGGMAMPHDTTISAGSQAAHTRSRTQREAAAAIGRQMPSCKTQVLRGDIRKHAGWQ